MEGSSREIEKISKAQRDTSSFLKLHNFFCESIRQQNLVLWFEFIFWYKSIRFTVKAYESFSPLKNYMFNSLDMVLHEVWKNKITFFHIFISQWGKTLTFCAFFTVRPDFCGQRWDKHHPFSSLGCSCNDLIGRIVIATRHSHEHRECGDTP